MSGAPTVAVFRPDDERLADAVETLEALGAEVIADPMLKIVPTDTRPRTDTDIVVFTSRTGIACLPEDWQPGGATIAAIGPTTADAARAAGYEVEVVPEEYSSAGLVEALGPTADGRRIEIARSDHGSATLIEGLIDAGAYVHETVLYALERPDEAGRSAELAADGALDSVLFTSSLTVEHFLAAAADRGITEQVRDGLADSIVGAIGAPTATTAREHGLAVDVVPEAATFDALARAALSA